jgi:glycosyltransferase involved in cell wall biosynthesis
MMHGRLRIAQVAPVYERVPPVLYGGTERVVSYLTEELVRRGHDVTLFASGDSQTKANLVAAAPTAVRLASGSDYQAAASSSLAVELGQVVERAGGFDVIHCHVDYPAFWLGRAVHTAVVHTLHGRLDVPYLRPVFSEFTDAHVVSISDAQRAALGELEVRWAATVSRRAAGAVRVLAGRRQLPRVPRSHRAGEAR